MCGLHGNVLDMLALLLVVLQYRNSAFTILCYGLSRLCAIVIRGYESRLITGEEKSDKEGNRRGGQRAVITLEG